MNAQKPDSGDSSGYGVAAPLFGCAYAVFSLLFVRKNKGGVPMSGSDAFWYSIPIFGLSLFFHAKYFRYYRSRPWLRWLLLVTSIVIMAIGLFGVFAPKIGPWL